MIIIRNIKVPLESDFSDLPKLLSGLTGKSTGNATVKLYKKAVDARKKDDISFNCAFTLDGDDGRLSKEFARLKPEQFCEPEYDFGKASRSGISPVVVGFGPAGMFAALCLARAGLRPIVLERGCDADRRSADVSAFFAGGKLKENSNIQFGEGGAGTFSDGKLNTGIKDVRIRTVIKEFAVHGADNSILYAAKPHIGTDVLVNVVKSIRKEITGLGGQVLFEHTMTAIMSNCGKVAGVIAETPNGAVNLCCNHLILAPGHSARDTFLYLHKSGIAMEPKAFAVGARIEHRQHDIDVAQYGAFAGHPALGAADYRLAEHLPDGRGVFTFCMCPGGEVVNASSENGRIAVNGMSNSMRNGKNANSAVLVGVGVEDFFRSDVLDGMDFQRGIEEKAYSAGKGLPVSESVGSFLGTAVGKNPVIPTVRPDVSYGHISDVLPQFATDSLKKGIVLFGRKLHGFDSPDAVLTSPETRSSSPVRILRNDSFESSLAGLYPCGEGAGYAGGITSAAVDGMKAAEKVIEAFC